MLLELNIAADLEWVPDTFVIASTEPLLTHAWRLGADWAERTAAIVLTSLVVLGPSLTFGE